MEGGAGDGDAADRPAHTREGHGRRRCCGPTDGRIDWCASAPARGGTEEGPARESGGEADAARPSRSSSFKTIAQDLVAESPRWPRLRWQSKVSASPATVDWWQPPLTVSLIRAAREWTQTDAASDPLASDVVGVEVSGERP